MQDKKGKISLKTVTAATLAVPLAVSSLAVPGLGEVNKAEAAVELSGVPVKVQNATIDWDTFSHEAISLVWDANPDAQGYIVERNGEEVYRGAAPRFDDTGLASGATYQYAIYAYNDKGLSVPNIDYIQTDMVFQTVVLNWLEVEGAEEFLIERNGEIIASVPGDVLTFSDTEALVGNKYRYRVLPVDGQGEGLSEIEWPELIPDYDDILITDPPQVAPTSRPIPVIELTVEENKEINLNNYFSDANGDTLDYSVESADTSIAEAYATGATGSNLQVTGKSLGNTNLLITANDGNGGTVQRQVQVKVVEPAVESPEEDDREPEPLPDEEIETRTIPNQTIDVGESKQLNLNNYFNDPDGSVMKYTVHVNNQRVRVSELNSTLTLEGLERGEATVTVYADDGFGHVANSNFKVTVIDNSHEPEPEEPEVPDEPEDRVPVAGSLTDTVIDVGQTITKDIGSTLYDPDGDYVTYTVETNVDGIISHSTVGAGRNTALRITGVKAGQTLVKVTVADDFGNSASSSFVVKVEEPFEVTPEPDEEEEEKTNQPPTTKFIPGGSVVIGTKKVVHLDNYFKDPEGDALTYSARGNNSNVGRVIKDNKLELEGIRLGDSEITVFADDGHGNIVSSKIEIKVVPAPEIPTYYDVQDVIYGPDFLELEWYPILGAAGYWIFLNGEEVYDQPEDGSYFYHYRAEGLDPSADNVIELLPYDGEGNVIGDGEVFPFPPNDGIDTFEVAADVAENDVTISWNVGDLDPTAYKVAIKDAEGNVVDSKEYSYAGATQHVAKIEKAGVYTASVSPKVNGEYLGAKAVEFVIEQDFIVNKAPVAIGNGLENIRVTVGAEPYVKDLSEVFEDPEGGELTYSIRLGNVNASAIIEGSQLTVVGNTPGTTTATVTVTDAEGDSFKQNLLIYIEKPENKAPIVETNIEDVELAINASPLTFDAASHFTDPEGDNVIVTVGTLSNANVAVTTDGTNITITPRKIGTTTVQLTGQDSEGKKVTTSFAVTVKEVAPVSPENFTATATAYNEIELSFDKVANAKKYIIKRDGEVITETSNNSYVDKNLTAETAYEYEVIAINDVGESEPSVTTVTTPEMPTLENLTADVTEQTIVLNWDAFLGSDTKYKVFRYVVQADGTLKLDNYGQTVYTNTFTDSNLKGQTKYQYKVVPFVSSKNAFVEEFNATVDAETAEVNLAPVVSTTIPKQTLKADDAPKALDLTEYFTDPNGDALTYEVVDVTRTHVTVEVNGSNMTITPNRVGSGQVTLKVTDSKGLSVEHKFVVDVVVAAPTAVENLKLEALSHQSVKISFEASANATSYIIKRDGLEIKKTTETTFTDTTVTANTTYNYEVIAVNESGEATATNSVTTPEIPLVQNVKAEATASDKAKVTWDAFDGASRYRVVTYTRDANGTFVQEGFGRTTTSTELEYTPLTAGKEYYFGIIPYVTGEGFKEELTGLSNTITTPEPTPPALPTPVEFDVTLDGLKANLSITPLTVNGETVTQYRLYQYVQNAEGQYNQVGSAKVLTELNQVYEGLEAGKTYKFVVQPRVNNSYSTSVYHNSKEITVPGDLTPPSTDPVEEVIVPEVVQIKDVTVTINAANKATVTWDGMGQADTFKVWRYIVNADGTHTQDNYGRKVVGATTFVDNDTLKPNTEYLYVIVPLGNNVYASSSAKGGLGTTGAGTNTDGSVSSIVTNVQATKSGANALVTWDAYEGATKYRVYTYYQLEDGSWKQNRSKSSITGTNTSIGIKEGVKNKIVVQPLVSGTYKADYAGELEVEF